MVRELPERLQEDRETALRIIAWSGVARPDFERPIITPFVIPTVLAALWVILRYAGSWSQAVAGAIRLGGDVDTLGAIVGALAGVRLGLSVIPAHLANAVLDADRLRRLALRYHALVCRRMASNPSKFD